MKKEGFDKETNKYYDVNGNVINVNDFAVRLVNYNTLDVDLVKSLGNKFVTFNTIGRSEYCNVISLTYLGINYKQKFYTTVHTGRDSYDLLGNKLNVGDVVLSTATQASFFIKGTVKSIANKKCVIENLVNNYPSDINKSIKYLSNVISLTALGLEDLTLNEPNWNTIW